MPESWHIAKIRAVFKKGDAADRANYRQISLLNTGYKLFVLILLNRLRSSNIDSKLWHSQFGFKAGANVSDAVFVARRHIDKAFARRDSSLVLLALDWAKAFDSIMPEPMFTALHRFGRPLPFINMIRNIYSSRSFFVCDSGVNSNCKPKTLVSPRGALFLPFYSSS